MKTDSNLQSDVLAELKWWPGVDEAHIGVTAKGGVVTLSGHVAHYAEKVAAEDAAKGVYGVSGLANEIQVEMPGTHKRNDADIAETALNALKWNYAVPADKVKVIVKNGWVTLEGNVDWQYQKDAAGTAVRSLLGVSMVSNNLGIKPVLPFIDVQGKIEAAFRRNADLDARRIQVASTAGHVTLTGTVSTWAEKDAAVWAAWSAPGVNQVTSELAIVP